ncbi:MAG TPA: NYN domain-containing protein [Ktedonobacteraceae bacterium]
MSVPDSLAPRRAMNLRLRILSPGVKKQVKEKVSSSGVAILIDGENMVADHLPQILSEAEKLGDVTIKRVYGNWTTHNFHRHWSAPVIQYALEPIHHIEAKSGYNGSDIALAIGAMDILHTHSVKNFCLVTSDSDYTPLVMRLRADGCTVYGFGRPNTPEILKKAFTKFFPTAGHEPIIPESAQRKEVTPQFINLTNGASTHVSNLSTDVSRLTDLFIRAYHSTVTSTANNDGWVPISLFGRQLLQLDARYKEPFGNMNLTALVKLRSDLLETRLLNPDAQIEIRLIPQSDRNRELKPL